MVSLNPAVADYPSFRCAGGKRLPPILVQRESRAASQDTS
jgi:hypothetical protein